MEHTSSSSASSALAGSLRIVEIRSHDLLLPAQSLALGLAAAQHLHLLPPWQGGRYGYVAAMTIRRPLDRSDLVSVTCSADAEPERCPKCGSDEVYLVLDNLPATYKLCNDCEYRWDVPA